MNNHSQLRPIIMATLAYTLLTFPLAAIWHAVLFKDLYHGLGYFQGEPSFALGLLSIFIQGLVLSFLYPRVKLPHKGIRRGLNYVAIIGIFFWTSHVLAYLAKQTISQPLFFLLLESVYLILQFACYGIALGLIFSDLPKSPRA